MSKTNYELHQELEEILRKNPKLVKGCLINFEKAIYEVVDIPYIGLDEVEIFLIDKETNKPMTFTLTRDSVIEVISAPVPIKKGPPYGSKSPDFEYIPPPPPIPLQDQKVNTPKSPIPNTPSTDEIQMSETFPHPYTRHSDLSGATGIIKPKYDPNLLIDKAKAGAAPYESVNHPKHYNQYPMEVFEMMSKIWGKENLKIFCEMNAFKYRMRAGLKPGVSQEEDLKNETFYLNYKSKL